VLFGLSMDHEVFLLSRIREEYDATVVRMVMVPAAIALLGRANWWLPGWLDHRLPHVPMEDAGVPGRQVADAAEPRPRTASIARILRTLE
jgi:RND superfamily putative drug exporter